MHTMGVINITPNSFSDGGLAFSLDTFVEKWNQLLEQDVSILDIGAESTAPFNNPVDEKEEKDRFERMLFPILDTLNLPKVLSIDTYRPSVFKFVYEEVKKVFPRQKFIWNDVSGILDKEVWDLLKECEDASYVLGHTLIKDRGDTSNHMAYQVEGEILDALEMHFNDGLKEFEKRGIESRLIFDPLFGFSKSLEQNWQLVNKLPFLVKRFSVEQKWLLGISKKSFLQRSLPPNLTKTETLQYSEYLHSNILSRWMHQMGEHLLIFRVHDPIVVSISRFIEKTL